MPVREKPTIQLLFDGLILLHFAEDMSSCEAMVVHGQEHQFKIKITDHPTSDQELTGDEKIGNPVFYVKEPVTEDQKVRIFLCDLSDPKAFDRSVGGDIDRDFRWVLNLESDDIFGRKLNLPDHAAQTPGMAHAAGPSMTIKHGEFYTACHHKVTKVIGQNGDLQKDKVHVASMVGCNVNLEGTQTAILEYGPEGGRKQIEFSGGQHCTIEVTNNRPFPPPQPPPNADQNAREVHYSDFHHYYKFLNVEPETRFNIWPGAKSHEAAINFTDDRYPCDPTTCGC